MTTQELLDWAAIKLEGWTFRSAIGNHWWEQSEGDPGTYTHPLPATLDTAAMLFEKYLPGWTLEKHEDQWFARSPEFAFKGRLKAHKVVRAPVTGNTREAELHDRLALVYAAIQAKEKA